MQHQGFELFPQFRQLPQNISCQGTFVHSLSATNLCNQIFHHTSPFSFHPGPVFHQCSPDEGFVTFPRQHRVTISCGVIMEVLGEISMHICQSNQIIEEGFIKAPLKRCAESFINVYLKKYRRIVRDGNYSNIWTDYLQQVMMFNKKYINPAEGVVRRVVACVIIAFREQKPPDVYQLIVMQASIKMPQGRIWLRGNPPGRL